MKLIVGLGNPGSQYRNTRHNVGFMLIEKFAEQLGIAVDQSKFKGLIGEARIGGQKVVLLKPMTYMNLSGESVRAAADWYKIEAEDILVVFDDLNIDVGRLRFRPTGSAGGHNGIKSMIAHLGTEEFPRLKIGIGRPEVMGVVDHVLSTFSDDDRLQIEQEIIRGIDGIKEFITGSEIQQVMNKFNG